MDIAVHEFRAMGSPCKLLLQGDSARINEASRAVELEVQRIEQKFSRYLDDSILSQINHNAGIKAVEIDAETLGLLNYADACYQQSDGLFDITSGILRQCWNFKSKQLPAQEHIAQRLPLINWSQVELTQSEQKSAAIFLPSKGMEIDFGGFGKEYAADKAAEVCKQYGIHHGLVDLGGDIRIVGDKVDGSGWAIGIRNPKAPEQAITSVVLHQGAMATSGNYERFMEVRGKRYCHLLNAKTGWPVNYWASITILAPQCLVAGSLATLSMLSEAEGLEWLEQQDIPFYAIDINGAVFQKFPKSAIER